MKRSEKIIFPALIAAGIGLVAVLAFFLSGESPDTLDDSGRSGLGAALDPDGGLAEGSFAEDGADLEKRRLEPSATTATPDPGAGSSDDSGDFAGSGVITGRILNEFGSPVPRADVALNPTRPVSVSPGLEEVVDSSGSGQRASCRSDQHGKFRLEGIAADTSLRLRAVAEGFVPGIVTIKAFDGVSREIGDMVLEQGGSVSGFVTDGSGRPIAGATVTGRPTDREGGSAFLSFAHLLEADAGWQATTRMDGSFVIDGLPQGRVSVTADHPDHPATRINGIAVFKGQETDGIEIVLAQGLVISGRAVDASGDPVAEATVIVEPDIDIDLENLESLDTLLTDLVRDLSPTLTDDDGFFTLKGLAKGRYTIIVDAPAFLRSRHEKVAAGTSGLVAVLREGGWIFGRVVDGVSGEGIEDFTLDVIGGRDGSDKSRTLKGAAAAASSGQAPDVTGAFFTDGFGIENFELRFVAEGYAFENVTGAPPAPGTGVEVIVRLWKEATIAGRLVDYRGDPVVEGEVVLQAADGKAAYEDLGAAASEMGARMTFSTSSGDRTGGGESEPAGNAVSVGKAVSAGKAESGEDGAFLIEGIAAGDYRLAGSHDLHADAEPLPVTVSRGEAVTGLEIRLGPAGSIEGTAFSVDGAPIPGAWIHVSRGGGMASLIAAGMAGGEPDIDLRNVTADETGSFRIDGLTPGVYQLRLLTDQDEDSLSGLLQASISSIADGGGASAVRANVTAGKVTRVDLIETVKGGITGTVREAGRPVAGVRLKLFSGGLLAILPIKTTVTDDGGAFAFDRLEEGDYSVHLELPGHPDPRKEPVIVTAGENAVQDFTLPSGRIAGRIVDAATGSPVAGIRVALDPLEKKGGGGLFESLNIKVTTRVSTDGAGDDSAAEMNDNPFGGKPKPVLTSADGTYAIGFVDEGSYRIKASGGDYVDSELGPVNVRAGRETSGLDFRLSRGYAVSGTVLDAETGNPVGLCRIECSRIDKGRDGSEPVKSETTTLKGVFEIPGLEPGRYLLKPGNDPGAVGIEVVVEQADVTGLELKTN